MDFAGRMNQNVAKYKIGVPVKMWRRAPFAWMVVVLQKVWVFIVLCINKDQDDESLPLLEFEMSYHMSIMMSQNITMCHLKNKVM